MSGAAGAQVVAGALAGLGSVDLAELNQVAALQTRVDRKYVLGVSQVAGVLAGLPVGARVLEIAGRRCFGYDSVYFDTVGLLCYHAAAGRRRRRFKVRTRTYLDSGSCWLEVKTRGPRRTTVKHRLPYEVADRDFLTPGRWFVNEVLCRERVVGARDLVLVPSLVTRYRRCTVVLPGEQARVTVDTDLGWWVPAGASLAFTGRVVVETKTAAGASAVDRLLWSHGHRPVRISKYAVGLAALYPELPATRWRVTLRRHVHALLPPAGQDTPSDHPGQAAHPQATHPSEGGAPLCLPPGLHPQAEAGGDALRDVPLSLPPGAPPRPDLVVAGDPPGWLQAS